MAGIAPKRAVAPAVRGQRFAVVVARFNEPISKKLLDGALGARDDARVLHEHLAQARFGIADASRRAHDFVFHALHAEGHDLEEHRLFAGEVVIQTSLGHPQGAGDVADCSGVEAAIAENPRSRAADFGPPGGVRL